MTIRPFPIVSVLLILGSHLARATQADDTTITITGQNAGPTPFISQLSLMASDTSVLSKIQFTITPKTGSVTRPLSATYSNDYLTGRGNLIPQITERKPKCSQHDRLDVSASHNESRVAGVSRILIVETFSPVSARVVTVPSRSILKSVSFSI